jgi:Flp pilus assembly protein TadG
MVETALVFPILVGLFLGVSEFSEAFTVSRRLEVAAHTAADLVARAQTVTADDLTGIKAMIDETIKPFSTATVGLIVTSVVADTDNATTVAWSHAQGTGVSPYAAGSTISVPTGVTLPDTSVVFAEVKYSFKSTLSALIVGSVPLRAEAYQRPRYSSEVVKQ